MTRRASSRRVGDFFIIKLLRSVMSAAMVIVGLGFAAILFWILALDADSAAEVPQPLVILVIIALGVTAGCHSLIKWVKPALR